MCSAITNPLLHLCAFVFLAVGRATGDSSDLVSKGSLTRAARLTHWAALLCTHTHTHRLDTLLHVSSVGCAGLSSVADETGRGTQCVFFYKFLDFSQKCIVLEDLG